MKESSKILDDICLNYDLLIYGESETRKSSFLPGDKRSPLSRGDWIFGLLAIFVKMRWRRLVLKQL